MTSRTRNLTILGVVAALLVLALLVIVPGHAAVEGHQARARPRGRHRARLRGRADAAGSRGHAAGGRRRDRDDAQARRLARRLGARDPARRRAPDLGRPAGRPERRARARAGRQHGPAPVLRLGAEHPHRPRGLRGRPRRSIEAVEAASKQKGKAEATDVPPGSDMTPAQADKANNTAKDRYYLFGPDQLPIGPDKKPLRTGTYEPSGTCKDLLSDYDAEPGPAPEFAKDTECLKELEALGSGGPPAGSRVIKVPEGVRGGRAGAGRRTSRPQIQRYTVLEDDSELSGEDIKNPKADTDPNTNAPLVTMEFTDKGREAFARVTKRIAERGFEQSTLQPGRHRQGAVLPALRDHARQPDRLAGDDRLHLEPRGDRRPHGRPDRERRRLQRRQRPGREPAHRRAADRAQADLGDPGVGDARPAGAAPGPVRRRRRPAADDPLPARLLPRARPGGDGGAADLRGLAVRAGQADPDHAHAAGHRGPRADAGGGGRRQHRHVRANKGGGARRADRSLPPSPRATRRRCGRSSTRTS